MITKDQIEQVHNELSKLQAVCDPLMSHQEEWMVKILDGVLCTLKSALDAPEPRLAVSVKQCLIDGKCNCRLGGQECNMVDVYTRPSKVPELLSESEILDTAKYQCRIELPNDDIEADEQTKSILTLARAIEVAVLERMK